MKKTLVEKYVENPVHMRLFQQERAIYEATELLERVMRETGVSRTELARRLGRSKGWVTQLLDGEANKTIRTVADAFAVLGREYHSSQRPIQIGTEHKSKAGSKGLCSTSVTVVAAAPVTKLYRLNECVRSTVASASQSGGNLAEVAH
jgi:hypothetical protein